MIGKIIPRSLLAAFIFLHLVLLGQTFFIDEQGSMRSTWEGYGDIPFHLTQITKFAYGNAWDFKETIFLGEWLRYPFLVNLLSGLLLRATDLWTFAVLAPILLSAVLGSVFAYLSYKHILKKEWAALLALALFFLGSAATAYVWDAEAPAENTIWIAPLIMSFLHQRTFVFGFFLFSFLLWLLLKKRYAPAAIVFGILPFAHSHSFLVAAILVFLFALRDRAYLKTAVIGGLIALPQVLYILATGDSSFIHFRLGWMTERGIGAAHSWLPFMWANFGILLPVFFASLLFSKLRFWGALSLLLFIIANLIQFQPWDFDNNKILVYWQFFAAPVVAAAFLQYNKLGIILFTALFAFVTWPGVSLVYQQIQAEQTKFPVIFDAPAQNIAQFVRMNTNKKTLVLYDSSHLNPVTSLSGKPAVVGYPGWLWTRGIEYGPREQQVKAFYKEPAKNAHLLSQYSIEYILINTHQHNKALFEQQFQPIYENKNFILYSAR